MGAKPISETMERVDEKYECPDCGSDEYYSPTYRRRKCTRCGCRGHETEWAIHETADCPDCGEENVRTHTDGVMDGFVCRACWGEYRK